MNKSILVVSVSVAALLSGAADAIADGGNLEVPSGRESGIGYVSGWKCPINGNLTFEMDGGGQLPLAKGISRGDTAGICGNSGLNGFIAQFNYNLLGDGSHTARVFDNGVEFASRSFEVKTLGEPFRRGLVGSTGFSGFPGIGEMTTLTWKESLQNFVITDITLPPPGPVFHDNFEGGFGFWSVTNGVWEVGTPPDGPKRCHQGENCAVTVLAGDYPPDHGSGLVSPSIDLPTIDIGSEIQLRFWEWHVYGGNDGGVVRVQEFDPQSATFGAFKNVSGDFLGTSGGVWVPASVDLAAYAGKRIRLGFFSGASTKCGPACAGASAGWHIDEVAVIVIP